MIKRYDEGYTTGIKDYKSAVENQGKVAIFDFDHSRLIAEGDDGTDWLELEMLCEQLRENGNYKIVIVPEKQPSINLFRRVLA